MSCAPRLPLIVLGLALPFGVAAFFLNGPLSPILSLAMLLICSLGLLWGLWRGRLSPRQVFPSVPIFGAMLLGIHGHSALLTLERYALAMLLAVIIVLALVCLSPPGTMLAIYKKKAK